MDASHVPITRIVGAGVVVVTGPRDILCDAKPCGGLASRDAAGVFLVTYCHDPHASAACIARVSMCTGVVIVARVSLKRELAAYAVVTT